MRQSGGHAAALACARALRIAHLVHGVEHREREPGLDRRLEAGVHQPPADALPAAALAHVHPLQLAHALAGVDAGELLLVRLQREASDHLAAALGEEDEAALVRRGQRRQLGLEGWLVLAHVDAADATDARAADGVSCVRD